jgi:aminoglycoside phosphotransferase (APT) family kinase protein
MTLEACLPAELRDAAPSIKPLAGGFSRAGVYHVEAAGGAFVLKIASESEPLADWKRALGIRQLAAGAGLAPRVVHADEARRAVLSAFIDDRSFPALYGNPSTRERAIEMLGRLIRRTHELPVPENAPVSDPRAFLASVWSDVASSVAGIPEFVGPIVERVLGETPPATDRAPVLSHNDVNPTNLIFDGEHLLLLDWETAGPNDPWYDLAAISVFVGMDEPALLRLIEAYDGTTPARVPERLAYFQRVVAALAGSMFLRMALRAGFAGADGTETLESTSSLHDYYQGMMAGAVSPSTPEGKWQFGLTLVKTCAQLSE